MLVQNQLLREVKQGDMTVVVDGLNGDMLIVNPTEDELMAYQDKRERYFAKKNYKKFVMLIYVYS